MWLPIERIFMRHHKYSDMHSEKRRPLLTGGVVVRGPWNLKLVISFTAYGWYCDWDWDCWMTNRQSPKEAKEPKQMQRLHGTNCRHSVRTRLLIHGMAPIRSLPIAVIPGEMFIQDTRGVQGYIVFEWQDTQQLSCLAVSLYNGFNITRSAWLWRAYLWNMPGCCTGRAGHTGHPHKCCVCAASFGIFMLKSVYIFKSKKKLLIFCIYKSAVALLSRIHWY